MDPLNFPRLSKHVTDFSGVLSPIQITSYSENLATHEANTTEQALVVLFPHREGHELLDIGLKIFNENRIGLKSLNNGILLIIATEEKKIRIITGKGMELKYSEMRCRDIIENQLRPLLNEGKYEEILKEWSTIIRSADMETMHSGQESAKEFENIISNLSPQTSKIQKIIGQFILGSFILLFFGIFFGDEKSRFLYVCLLFAIPFLLGGLFGVFRGTETIIQKIIIKLVTLTLGSLFLSGAYFQIYCHTQNTSFLPKNESICKVFPIIIKDTGSGKNSLYKESHSSSSSSSSSSSFGGGGGSSNGGGYGD